VKLVDLLDEGLERAERKLVEKGRQAELSPDEFAAAREAVAYGFVH
jgi:arginyl-tRNA synthetase